MKEKLLSEASSLSLFLRNRAGATGDLNDYDKELLRDSIRVIDEHSDLVEKLSKEYLEICDGDCTGDISVGIPSCPFYRWPDIDDTSSRISLTTALPRACLSMPSTA